MRIAVLKENGGYKSRRRRNFYSQEKLVSLFLKLAELIKVKLP